MPSFIPEVITSSSVSPFSRAPAHVDHVMYYIQYYFIVICRKSVWFLCGMRENRVAGLGLFVSIRRPRWLKSPGWRAQRRRWQTADSVSGCAVLSRDLSHPLLSWWMKRLVITQHPSSGCYSRYGGGGGVLELLQHCCWVSQFDMK